DGSLDLITPLHEEELAGGQLGAPDNHRVRSGSDHTPFCLAFKAQFRAYCGQLWRRLDRNVEFHLVRRRVACRRRCIPAELAREIRNIEVFAEPQAVNQYAAIKA